MFNRSQSTKDLYWEVEKAAQDLEKNQVYSYESLRYHELNEFVVLRLCRTYHQSYRNTQYLYIYIHIYVCVYIYVYIYIYTRAYILNHDFELKGSVVL